MSMYNSVVDDVKTAGSERNETTKWRSASAGFVSVYRHHGLVDTCCVITLTVEVIYFSIKTYPPIPCLPDRRGFRSRFCRFLRLCPKWVHGFNGMHARDMLTVPIYIIYTDP